MALLELGININTEAPKKLFEGKKVYFSGSIKGVRHPDPNFFRELVDYMKENGAIVLSEHVAAKSEEEKNSLFIKESGIRRDLEEDATIIRQADLGWVNEAHYLIAIVDTTSFGVGMEVQHTLDKHKMGMNLTPVLCLVRSRKWQKKLSNMVKGIGPVDSPVAFVKKYKDKEDAKGLIREHLTSY